MTFTDEGNDVLEADAARGGPPARDAVALRPRVDTLVHHVNQALRAHTLFQKDKDYIVRDGKVVLIDEFTGRMMIGRRLSDGLHQAIEAKEGAKIQPENVTLAAVTFQNYFRLYKKLAGMTGTALTEADEFREIYGLGVVEIPTNRPVARKDEHDAVYRTAREKYEAIVKAIREAHEKGQPILVGTTSIEKSEMLSTLLKTEGIPHNVLNAREHAREAQIVAEAGQPGAVTIATNMAGRGTDIQLGGNVEMKVLEALAADPEAHPDEVRARIEAEHAADKERVKAGRGPLRARHRAAREPPHRQPAARPLGPAGRPRQVHLLPVARGRPHADLRVRAARQGAVHARDEGRRGHRPPLGEQVAWSGRRPRSRGATSTSASSSSSSTT